MNLLPGVIEGLDAGAAQAMTELSYNSITCVLLALDRPKHPDLSWIYLPHESQGPANRVTYMSNYSPGNAPEGQNSLMCEITSPGGQPIAGPELEQQTIDGLIHAGLMTREELLFTDRESSRFAYIVYDAPFEARRKTALDGLAAFGIEALGRFGQYEYWNSDQCVIASRAMSERLLAEAAQG